MRILITTAIYPPDIGGPATYVPKVVQGLAARGHEVVVLTLADVGGEEATEFGRLVRVPRHQSLLGRKLVTCRMLFRWVVWADLVYAQGLFGELLPSFWLFGHGTPRVAKFVGDWGWERSRVRNWYEGTIDDFQVVRVGVRVGLMRALRTFVARRYKRVVVPSDYFASLVRTWYREPPELTIIYNGVSVFDRASLPSAEELSNKMSLKACTVCRLVPWKRIGELLEIVAAVPGVQLQVIGEGELRAGLERKAEELDLTDRVTFLGALPRTSVLAKIRSADLFLLNSDYEGLPHAVIEAMALGRTVLARASGGTSEVVVEGETGFVVQDAGAFAERLALLRDNRNLREKLGAAGRRRYEARYTDQKMIEQTINLIEDIGARTGFGKCR